MSFERIQDWNNRPQHLVQAHVGQSTAANNTSTVELGILQATGLGKSALHENQGSEHMQDRQKPSHPI